MRQVRPVSAHKKRAAGHEKNGCGFCSMKMGREKPCHATRLRRILAGNGIELGQPVRPRYCGLQAMSLAQLHGVYFIGMDRHMPRPQLRRRIGRQRLHLSQRLCRDSEIGVEEGPVPLSLQRQAAVAVQGCEG